MPISSNGEIRTRAASAVGIEIPSNRLIVQSPETCRLVMREDEARALRDALDKQLAELDRVNNPARIGRPKGAKTGTSKGKPKGKRKTKTDFAGEQGERGKPEAK
jgi:hypothetical protein